MFEIGHKVVYPTHGVGLIEQIEEKEVSGRRESFYVLRILGNHTRIMVPTTNATRVGLRAVIQKRDVPKVMAQLKRSDVEISSNWNRRFKDNLERIRTGSIYEIALVLRKLILLQKERHLSFGEKKMLESVRWLLVNEISHAAEMAEEKVRRMIDKTVATA